MSESRDGWRETTEALAQAQAEIARLRRERDSWVKSQTKTRAEVQDAVARAERAEAARDAAVGERDALAAAGQCALAQLEADHDSDAAAAMFGGEPDPARAQAINRHDVADMIREALANLPALAAARNAVVEKAGDLQVWLSAFFPSRTVHMGRECREYKATWDLEKAERFEAAWRKYDEAVSALRALMGKEDDA